MPDKLERIFDEICRALENGFAYIAISVLFSIPDICSAMEKEPGHERYRKIMERYQAWCEQYVRDSLMPMQPSDLWAIRGGLVHNANPVAHAKSRHRKIAFILDAKCIQINGIMTSIETSNQPAIAMIPCHMVYEAMYGATEIWWKEKSSDRIVLSSLKDLIAYRTDVPGHMLGVPVIM
ncbi:hypothetical protein PX554_13835 [Sphingomonas sp. H39-1-10]|uniref:hypothetical protein n=1 Tax=Sphingomonas pollutisoli TaxID=3030829 RepID=UPI0023B9BF32|nr:hypothetical protein [Sphingomonas pollutisoli]MDF0489217.1 hypothetical protein [Sphingomonas pollutisoli]